MTVIDRFHCTTHLTLTQLDCGQLLQELKLTYIDSVTLENDLYNNYAEKNLHLVNRSHTFIDINMSNITVLSHF